MSGRMPAWAKGVCVQVTRRESLLNSRPYSERRRSYQERRQGGTADQRERATQLERRRQRPGSVTFGAVTWTNSERQLQLTRRY